jgi:hypothetical protein
MPEYTNGHIPESLLVVFKRGHNDTDGDWYHALSPAAYARHLALVHRAYVRTGRVLEITDGFGAYRPIAAQILARNLYGLGAADPGKSSHGGTFEGAQTLAADYGNWAWVYEDHGGFAAFAEDCAAVGAWAGAITPARGYPLEEWHVIFPDPWGAVPTFEGVTDFTPEQSEEDDDMKAIQLNDTDDSGVIVQTLEAPFSRPRQVFQALCGAYQLTPQTLQQWQYDTAVREHWATVGRQTGAVAAAVGAVSGVDVDEDAIGAAVVAKMPKSFTVTAG